MVQRWSFALKVVGYDVLTGHGQDLLSHNVEQSKGQTTDKVTVVIHQDNLDVQAAVDFVWAKCKDAHRSVRAFHGEQEEAAFLG